MVWQLTPAEIFNYEIILGVLIGLLVMLAFFTIIPLARFVQRRKRTALLFALSNGAFLGSTIFMTIGIWDAIAAGIKAFPYYLGILGMNVGIILASLFLYLFYAEIGGVSRRRQRVGILIALGIIVFEMLPANNWFDPVSGAGFQLKYISYLLQTLYCVTVYLILAREFSHLSSRVSDQQSSFKKMTWGNILLAVFFLLMLLRVPFMDFEWFYVLQLASWGVQAAAIVLLFVGFMGPTLHAQQPKNTQ